MNREIIVSRHYNLHVIVCKLCKNASPGRPGIFHESSLRANVMRTILIISIKSTFTCCLLHAQCALSRIHAQKMLFLLLAQEESFALGQSIINTSYFVEKEKRHLDLMKIRIPLPFGQSNDMTNICKENDLKGICNGVYSIHMIYRRPSFAASFPTIFCTKMRLIFILPLSPTLLNFRKSQMTQNINHMN
jgi:hypothetical protein